MSRNYFFVVFVLFFFNFVFSLLPPEFIFGYYPVNPDVIDETLQYKYIFPQREMYARDLERISSVLLINLLK